MSKNQFGGITGDLAGWFLQMCECLMAAAVVAGDLLWF
jgi:adenosylcobinamide-GDP ribazoletransferase